LKSEIKQNKGSILKASVDYIKTLQNELNQAKELNEKFRQMSMLNRKLVSRVKVIVWFNCLKITLTILTLK
jgi:hypothetical protein